MKRRDLLKGAGTLVLGAPVVRASALLKSNVEPAPQGLTKNLVVAFAGPFCFWQGVPGSGNQDCHCITVMAPPVGPLYHKAPHQPWIGTSANEIAIRVAPGTTLTLAIDGYKSPASPTHSGTPSFAYEQQTGAGGPLFNLAVPVPDIIIGVHPTAAKMVCVNPSDPYCTQYSVYASGLSFVYKNVSLNGVDVKNGSTQFFKPCFINDTDLEDATLGVHLTPLDRHPDPDHKHAKLVWEQMLSMYPWMQKEITGIDFCPTFDPSSCDPLQCTTRAAKSDHPKPRSDHDNNIMVGPGSDCEVPIMNLGPPGSVPKHKN